MDASMRGALFENLVFSDVRKTIMAANKSLDIPPSRHCVRSTQSPGEFAIKDSTTTEFFAWQSVNEEVLHYASSMQNDHFNGLIISQVSKVKAIEIKMSDKFDPHWMGRLNRFDEEKSKTITSCKKYVIYTGPTMEVSGGMALNFRDVGVLLEE